MPGRATSRGAKRDEGNPTFLSQLQQEQANHMSAGIAPTEPTNMNRLTRRQSVSSVVSVRSSTSSMRGGSVAKRLSLSQAEISERDVKRAFEFFDTKGKGRVSLKDLRDGIQALQPWEKPLTKSEVLFLTKGQPFLTFETFEELLSSSQSSKSVGTVSVRVSEGKGESIKTSTPLMPNFVLCRNRCLRALRY